MEAGQEIVFETHDDIEGRCYVIRGRLGERVIEQRIALAELSHINAGYATELFLSVRESIACQLLEDQLMHCHFEILLDDLSDQVTMRAWVNHPNLRRVQEPFVGPITPGTIENMKCILRRKLEELPAQDPWTRTPTPVWLHNHATVVTDFQQAAENIERGYSIENLRWRRESGSMPIYNVWTDTESRED